MEGRRGMGSLFEARGTGLDRDGQTNSMAWAMGPGARKDVS